MLDCLPSPEDWSPETQLTFVLDHLQALRHHLEAIEATALEDPAAMLAAMPHLTEINLRSHEAYDLLRHLSAQSEANLTARKKRKEC